MNWTVPKQCVCVCVCVTSLYSSHTSEAVQLLLKLEQEETICRTFEIREKNLYQNIQKINQMI
jgi:hypothetical protein